MGTWGSGVLQSDAALDFFDQFSDRLEKEIGYWASPVHLQQVERSSASFLLAAIDLLATILEHYDHALIVNYPTIQPYKDAFFAAWDKDVADSTEQERLIITALFDRLKILEYGYDGTLNKQELEEFRAIKPPSLVRGTIKELQELNNTEWAYGQMRLLERVTDELRKELIYWFSLEQRKQLRYEHGDELIPAADMLAFICDYYHRSPELSARKIRHWQKVLLRFWDKAVARPEGMGKPDYEVGRRKVFVETFEKLEAVAQKYPPFWGDDE